MQPPRSSPMSPGVPVPSPLFLYSVALSPFPRAPCVWPQIALILVPRTCSCWGLNPHHWLARKSLSLLVSSAVLLWPWWLELTARVSVCLSVSVPLSVCVFLFLCVSLSLTGGYVLQVSAFWLKELLERGPPFELLHYNSCSTPLTPSNNHMILGFPFFVASVVWVKLKQHKCKNLFPIIHSLWSPRRMQGDFFRTWYSSPLQQDSADVQVRN